MLPLPTVTPIDVTAERLKDVDRRHELEVNAVKPGAQVKAALEGAALGHDLQKEVSREAAASAFQKLLDAGEPGRLEFWAANESPAHMDPRMWINPASSPEDQQKQALTWYKEMAGIKEESTRKAGQKKLVQTLSDPNAEPGQVAADALEAGASTGEVLTYTGKVMDKKSKESDDKRKKEIHDLDVEYKKLRNAGQRLLNAARSSKNQGLVAVISEDLKQLKQVKEDIKKLESQRDAIPSDDLLQSGARRSLESRISKKESEMSKIRARLASYSRDLPVAKVEEFFADVNEDEDAPPTNWPEARKARDGRWYVPDPNRPGKYLDVTDNPEE